MSPFPEDGLPGAFRKDAAGRAGARGPGETDEQGLTQLKCADELTCGSGGTRLPGPDGGEE